jgi:hypothetical protein
MSSLFTPLESPAVRSGVMSTPFSAITGFKALRAFSLESTCLPVGREDFSNGVYLLFD